MKRCPHCYSRNTHYIGTVGALDHFRCKACGNPFAEYNDESDEPDAQAASDQIDRDNADQINSSLFSWY